MVMIDKMLRSSIFFLLFVTIIFGLRTTRFAHANTLSETRSEALTPRPVLPGNLPTGNQGEMKIPEHIGEEVPSDPGAKTGKTRGTSGLPDDRVCATVDGKWECAPDIR